MRHAAAMIGFCLAAGAGRRLAPLTRVVPKPLLAPAGRPLVDLACDGLELAGAGTVVVNAHHGAARLVAHLAGRPGCSVVAEPELLGTGGGLANARRLGLLGDEALLVTCADTVVDPGDLAALARALPASGCPVVVGLVPRAGTLLPLGLDGAGRVGPDPDGVWTSAGVYALETAALDALPPGRSTLVEALLEPLWQRGALAGLPLVRPWMDAGTLHGFLAASAGLLTGRWPASKLPSGRLVTAGVGSWPVFVTEGARLDPAAVVAGPVALDADSRAGPGAVLTRAVVGPGAAVGARAAVSGSVLGPGARVAAGERAVAGLVG